MVERRKRVVVHNKNINVRISDELLNKVDNVAITHGFKRSDVIRLMIEDKLQRYSKTKSVSAEDTQKIRELLIDIRSKIGYYDTQILRIANNYNQLTRYVNTKKTGTVLTEYEKQLDEMNTYLFMLDEKLDSIVKALEVLDDF